MAVYFAEHTGPAAATAAMAVAGRRIRVRRVLISTATNGEVRIKQNPGPSEVQVLPALQARAGGPPLDVRFYREYPVADADASLGYASDISGPHGIWLEYEVVD